MLAFRRRRGPLPALCASVVVVLLTSGLVPPPVPRSLGTTDSQGPLVAKFATASSVDSLEDSTGGYAPIGEEPATPACIPCPGGTYCFPQCYHGQFVITIHVFVFNNTTCCTNAARVNLNGSTYGNDQGAFNLLSGHRVSLSAVSIQCVPQGPCFTFREWASDSGTIGNSRSSSTTFTPSGQGHLSLILTQGDPSRGSPANWGGYVWAGRNITAVAGEFNLSSATYVSGITNGCTGAEDFAIWVGIGGYEGTGALWQAGVVEMRNSSTAPLVIVPFYEEVYSATDAPPVYAWGHKIPATSTDIYEAEVWLNYDGLHGGYTSGSYLIADLTSQTTLWAGSYYFNSTRGQLTSPDRTTAEWIVEALGQGCNGNPNYEVYPAFGTILFHDFDVTDYGVSYLDLWQPILNSESWDVWQGGGCPSGHSLAQAVQGSWGGPTSFTVSYSGTCL